MYLSRIKLNLNKRETIIALANPQKIHGAVAHAYTNYKEARPLWRIDTLNNERYLLLLGKEPPNLHQIANQFSWQSEPNTVITKDYNAFLQNIENGSTWNFRLTANPVVCINGHRVPHVTPASQLRWLSDRAEKNGFVINFAEIIGTNTYNLQRGGGSKTKSNLNSVTFAGQLTVLDKTKFSEALKNGIGHSKAYGMGLLTIVKPV